MQLKFKKFYLLITIVVYCVSFLIQSNFSLFQTLAKETNIPRVNIVTILVDKEIYNGLSDRLKRYASNYVQNKLSDTKALVIPLNLTDIHAFDIYRMMENIYFDGLKDVNSSLVGLVMVGDIPLPVVNQDGYMFPTVYPYVDFENQKYVWDAQLKYFVPNGHPEGQAEIWHGFINYGTDLQAYKSFFDKIKKYDQNPDSFIGDSMWYDDFIAQKEGFSNEKFPYYRNRIMFAEDLGYQRFSPLMRDLFRAEQGDSAMDIISELESAANLNFSGKDVLLEMGNQSGGDSHTTKMVQQEIQTSFLADYNDLFSSVSMSNMRENVIAGGRWIKEYKSADGQKSLISDVDSSTSKLQVKDNVLLGNEDFQGLIENLNDLMEEMVDKKIADNKYDMDIVIPVSYENEGREKFRSGSKRPCISFPTRYDNYYFGLNARNVDSAQDLSIYRGTYRNLLNLSGVTYDSLEKGYNSVKGDYDTSNFKLRSIGASYDIFSNQVEGNRGYSMQLVENDLKVYDEEKKNSVVQYRRVVKKKVNEKFWSDDCEKNDKNHICEDPFVFAKRWRGGASPFYLDSESIANGRYQLSGYRATDSWRSIFDMGGFQSLLPGSDEGESGRGWVDGKGKGPQKAGASFKAYIKYSSPTERVGWEDKYGTKGSSMPFARYVNNTPDIHGISFLDMDYRRNGFVSDNKWQMSRESSDANIFTVALKPQYYDNTCNYYPSGSDRTIRWEKYTYKVISSIVKHVSTTEDEINGVDRNRYGKGGILEGYYINLKNSYSNVNKNVSDILTGLQTLENGAENSNIKGEIENLSGEMVEIQGLDSDISSLAKNIELLKSELENGSEHSDDWIRAKQSELSGLNQLLNKKMNLKTNVDAEISDSLTKLLAAIEKDKNILVDVYSAISSLSADEIVSSMEMIMKDEGLDSERFYGKKNNITKIGFYKEWISEFVGMEGDIKKGIESILTSYKRIFLSMNGQRDRWNKMKTNLKNLSEVNSDKIDKISLDMNNLFNISALLAVDDSKDNDNESVSDTVLMSSTAENIIKQNQQVSCPKYDTSENDDYDNEDDDSVGILGKFDGECGINNMFNWLFENDTKGPKIVAAAKGDADFIKWLRNNSVNTKTFTSDDWINHYIQWTKGPGYDSDGAKKNYNLLIGASEHMSGINLLTPDRPIDSPRYVSMQSIAGNEINFVYPDLFKVEVYTSKGKNKSGYYIHELLTVGEIKNNLVKYLNGKVFEYNKIIDEECRKAELSSALTENHYKKLQTMGYVGAIPDASRHGCNAKFTYLEFVEALGGEKMLDTISESLYYQSLTNKQKLSSENISEDIELIRKSFNVNDKRRQILKDYLTLGNDKTKNLVFEIPTYSASGYEVAFINSDGRDYIYSEDVSSVGYSDNFDGGSSSIYSNSNLSRQSTQQEKDIEDKCGIPSNGKLPIFRMDGSSPWVTGFKCWLKQTIKSPLKVKFTFDNALGDILSPVLQSSESDQDSSDGGKVNQYSDSSGGGFKSIDGKDFDKIITQMQINAKMHNEKIVGGILYDVYKNVRVDNKNVLLSESNPTSELKIGSVLDVGNITVEFVGTGDGCIQINSHELCNGKKFELTFNPKEKPFVGVVSSSDHVAGKVALIVRIKVGGEYIDNIIKYTVAPYSLDRVEIKVGNDKTVAGMLTPVEIVGYDEYNNKISWGLEKYDFTLSQGRFLKDGIYQSGFSTNDFRNLKFYFQAPLDAVDGSVSTLQILYSGNVIRTHNQPIVQAYPIVKINSKNVLQGRDSLEADYIYSLNNEENIYVNGKLEPKKLQKIEIAMIDLKGKSVNMSGQVSVTSQNGLVQIGQIDYQDNGDEIFVESSEASFKDGYVLFYYYPTTVAGDDVVRIDIPGLDSRVINFSIKPAKPKKLQLDLSDEYVNLNGNVLLNVFISDEWGNPVTETIKIRTDPKYVELKGVASGYRNSDVVINLIDVKDGTASVPIYGIGAGTTFVEAWFDDEEGSTVRSDVEIMVDDKLLPETGLNVLYLNYFGNDRGNQWGYFSDNNKLIENLMKNSEKIITTTTLLSTEEKIKKVLWKIDPGFKITNFGSESTILYIKSGKLYVGVGGLSEMEKVLPSFDWITSTLMSVDTLLNNKTTTKKNYIFYIPNESNYSIKNGILYESDNYIANVINGEVTLKLSDQMLDNGDNIWNLIYEGVDYGKIIVHFPTIHPDVEDFKKLGNRYVIGNLFTNGSTDQMYSVGLLDSLSEFELDSKYKSIQNSDETDERIGFLGDFKNITLFAEGQNVGEATRKYGSEFLINLGDPLLSRKDINEKVYGTNYDGGIGSEIYTDPDKDIFGVYQIDFNNDGLREWLLAYQDGSLKLSKNYGGNPDLREMQELMRLPVRIENVFVGDADGNGYQDIFVLTDNDQIRVYLNNGGKFDVDGSVVCLNQNVFEGEVSKTPSNLEGLNQFFVEDMDLDGVTDIVTYDEKGYIKVFYGGSTNKGPNYLSMEKYACDTGWYNREESNIKIVTALGVQISEDDVFDNSMIRWVGMSESEIEISQNDLSKYGINFDPNNLSNLIDTNNIKNSVDKISKEVVSSDKFDVGAASNQFIQDETKFQNITLYENTLIGGGESKSYVFAASSFLDPNNPIDKCSVWKNYRVKSGGNILTNKDIVTVKVTIKASDRDYCNGSYGDVIQGPWNIYYDETGKLKGIRFLQNQKNAVIKSKDGNFSYLIDNITLSPGEKMVFEYDLEYSQIPLKKMSVTHKTFWSDDRLPDIKLQSIDGCEKNFQGFINSGKRSFKDTLVPLQDIINKEYEEEDSNTKDYASEISTYGGDISKIPGLVGDRINRTSFIKQSINEAGIGLDVDLSVFEEQMDAIGGAIDDIMQGMCNGFSFGGSNNCKGLPVPFNQAFLAPGKYHLFGCREIPMGPLEGGLPVFFFPGTLWISVLGAPVSIPFPYGFKSPMDDFLWAGVGSSPYVGGVFPSMIRIYAAPTLTAQLGMAICMSPNKIWSKVPSPIADLGGNCVVFAVKPQCKGGDLDGGTRKNDKENPNEIFGEFVDEVKNSGICLQSQKGFQVTEKGHRSSPFNLYSYSSNVSNANFGSWKDFGLGDTRDIIAWKNMDVNGGSNNQIEFETNFLGIIDLETSAHIGVDSNVPNGNNSLFVGDVDVLGGDFTVNKIRGGIQQGVRQILIDKWLDPQIRYILNQLTKMHINVKLPDVSNLVDNEVQTIKNLSEHFGSDVWGDVQNIFRDNSGYSSTKDGLISTGLWSNINSNNLQNLNQTISNPFEALASLMNESNIVNISVEPVTVKVPMISAEDINGYEVYLKQWLDINGKMLDRWKLVLDEANFELKFKEWQKLQNQIYVNLTTLQKYRNFPFEMYEWVHVIDRYMAEIASLINSTIGYLSYWMTSNAQRFVGYVDAIVLMMNVIKTYQLLIDFSSEWGKNCGTCTRDTYDQYSCKLAILCNGIQLPIIQIPNFKLPNITIDLSSIDLGLDIILPSFNFQTVKIQLPELPNLSEPPSVGVNVDLKLPNIPMLPEPPELPELPSFIPEIELELPILPPAPEMPRLPNEIESIIKVAKLIGKIYCIVKGKFGLVGESSVKAKIEQLTQRTYEVKWIDTIMDFTNLSVAPIHNYGLDYEISAEVDLQFEFSTFYNYLDTLTKQINNLTTSSVNWVGNVNDVVNDNLVTGVTDVIDGGNLEFGVKGDLSMSDLSNIDLGGLRSDEVEYVDYNNAKSRLEEVLAYFEDEARDTVMGDKVKSSISNIEKQINKVNIISSNTDGLNSVKDEAIQYLNKERLNYANLAEMINNDYDGFLAMVDSNEINSKSLNTGRLLAYNVNLFNLNDSTKDVVKTIVKSNPYESILSNKKNIIDGYWNAINSNTASDLGLSQNQYLVLRDNISSMRNQITTLYSTTKPVSLTKLIAKNSLVSSDKTLLSSVSGGGRLGSNMEVANVVDPSALSDGIYGKIVEGADKGKLTKIVYADSFASVIGDHYYHTNHLDEDDVALWDDGAVYLKCTGGMCYNGLGGYRGYYVSNVIDKIPSEKTFITFDRETKLKISDGDLEVKNWKVDGQTYDDLKLSWRAQEDVEAYLIKLVERIDNSYEKVDYTSNLTSVRYVLALPRGENIGDLYSGNIRLELLRKTDKIKDLYGKDLVQIVGYDDNQDFVDVSISELDRKWYYARIATLSFRDNTYNIASPWSNQIVVGKQALGDDLSPEGNSLLLRPSVEKIVSEGDYLDGFVGTKYKLIVNRQDNVALSYISLLKDGKILNEKYTSNSIDSVSVDIPVHTKSESEQYNSIGIDQFGNQTEKVIFVDYAVPEISIKNVSKNSDGKTVAITAELSQDIDQGNVSFQRKRGMGWKTMMRKGLKYADFSLKPNQTLVVGAPYSFGNDIAMYDKNGEIVALMDPITAEITLQSGYKEDFEIKSIVQNGILFQLFNKKANKSVFSINVPAQSCLKIEADGYNVTNLPETGKMGMFNGGKVVHKNGSNVLFISPSCYLYADISTSLEGTYNYDRELDAVLLTLYQGSDLLKLNPIKVWFKVKPLMEN